MSKTLPGRLSVGPLLAKFDKLLFDNVWHLSLRLLALLQVRLTLTARNSSVNHTVWSPAFVFAHLHRSWLVLQGAQLNWNRSSVPATSLLSRVSLLEWTVMLQTSTEVQHFHREQHSRFWIPDQSFPRKSHPCWEPNLFHRQNCWNSSHNCLDLLIRPINCEYCLIAHGWGLSLCLGPVRNHSCRIRTDNSNVLGPNHQRPTLLPLVERNNHQTVFPITVCLCYPPTTEIVCTAFIL